MEELSLGDVIPHVQDDCFDVSGTALSGNFVRQAVKVLQ